jgi:hypothetical protein
VCISWTNKEFDNSNLFVQYMEIILNDNSYPFAILKISLDRGQPNDCRQSSLMCVGASVYLNNVLHLILAYTRSL